MKSITKKQLIYEIHEKENIPPRTVRIIFESFLELVSSHITTGGRIEIRDFGVFERVLRKQKIGRNPKKAKVPIIIPERYAIKFTPGKKMKNLLEKHRHRGHTTSLGESSTL